MFSWDSSRAYTANHESNLVSVLDTASQRVLTTVPVGTSPHSLALNPGRRVLAVADYDAPYKGLRGQMRTPRSKRTRVPRA